MLSVSFPLLGNFECGNPEKLKSKCIPVVEAQEYIAVSSVGCRLTLPRTPYCGGDRASELALLPVGRHLVPPEAPHQLNGHGRQPLLQATSRVVRATPLCPLARSPRRWEAQPPRPHLLSPVDSF